MNVDGDQLLATFRRYLRDHSLPTTPQRVAVAEAIFFSPDHLSADQVARRVAKRGGPVGTATVYRTLDLLVSSGLVAERDFGEGFKRYEPTPPGQTHEHCVCTGCGRVRVSSIFPPQCELVDREEGLSHLLPGQVLFAVVAESSTNEPSRLVAASIGLAMPADPSHHGYISEHHSYGQNELSAGDYAEDLAAPMPGTLLG